MRAVARHKYIASQNHSGQQDGAIFFGQPKCSGLKRTRDLRKLHRIHFYLAEQCLQVTDRFGICLGSNVAHSLGLHIAVSYQDVLRAL